MEGESSQQGNAASGAQKQHHSSGRSRSRGTDLFLATCRGFGVITALAAIFCIVINVITAFQSFRNGNDIFDGIFRCYAVVIAIFVVIAETEWEFFLKFCKVLQHWVGRGMLQIFVAVMTRAYPAQARYHHELFLIQSIAAYFLLGCGVIYVISGLLCIGRLKRSRQKKNLSRDQAIKDLENHTINIMQMTMTTSSVIEKSLRRYCSKIKHEKRAALSPREFVLSYVNNGILICR